jgi:hypothetical protein
MTLKENNLSKISNFYFIVFLLFWSIRFLNNLWLFQSSDTLVFYTGFDASFLLFENYLLTDLLKSLPVLLIIDLAIVACAIFILIKPKVPLANILFSSLLLFYIFLHYGSIGAHKHNLTGLWICSLLFWFKDLDKFKLALIGLRYYAIYAYASAGFWKIYRGAFSADYYFSTILKSHNALFMHHNPLHFKTKFIQFILDHASLGDVLFQLMTLGEFIFIIALFTYKFDKILAFFAFSFHLVSYFLVNVYFFEFTLILIPFFIKKPILNLPLISWGGLKHQTQTLLLFALFLIPQIIFFDKGIKLIKYEKYETTLFYGAYPIQNYMMYSFPYHADSFEDYEIYIDKKLLIQHSWLPIKSEQFEGNIIQYEKLKSSNFLDVQKIKAKEAFPQFFKNVKPEINGSLYGNWILRKTQQLSGNEKASVEILKCYYVFENQQVTKDTCYTILQN